MREKPEQVILMGYEIRALLKMSATVNNYKTNICNHMYAIKV